MVRTPGRPGANDAATAACPVCGRCFRPSGRSRYCSEGCRKTAWRPRHQLLPAPVVVPAGVPRRPLSVYECPTCDSRAVFLPSRRCSTRPCCPRCRSPHHRSRADTPPRTARKDNHERGDLRPGF